jgi:hypothetical protein
MVIVSIGFCNGTVRTYMCSSIDSLDAGKVLLRDVKVWWKGTDEYFEGAQKHYLGGEDITIDIGPYIIARTDDHCVKEVSGQD